MSRASDYTQHRTIHQRISHPVLYLLRPKVHDGMRLYELKIGSQLYNMASFFDLIHINVNRTSETPASMDTDRR